MSREEGTELTDYAWLDLTNGSISFSISERITVTLPLEEVMDFLNTVSAVVETLKTIEGVTLGAYEHDGVMYEQFMLTPDEGDFN